MASTLEPATLVQGLRGSFDTGVLRPLEHRLRVLSSMEDFIVREEGALLAALAEDLGKSTAEGWLTELALVRSAIRDLRRRLPRFIGAKRASVPLVQLPARASVRREALGCCLVIAPWNYPVQLLLIPAATALAAGNCVIAKPSELAPATSQVLAERLPRYVDHDVLAVVEGDAATTQAIIAAEPDHIFFTGSSATGKAVMVAAAERLIPVTLELGGKSPVYVDADADLEMAARRIAFGKFLNAGQSCVAPDYVLVHHEVAARLGDLLVSTIRSFFGRDATSSGDFGRIVSDHHFERLRDLASTHGGQVLLGGTADPSTRFFPPTVIAEPSPDSALMQEEIFGPILPLVTVSDAAAAASEIASRPSPLAIYCFTDSSSTMDLLEARTRSGAICRNTTAEQFALMSLPFGGVGASGFGAYHAGAGLEAFTHPRARLDRPSHPEPKIAYPPLSSWRLRLLRKLLRA